MSSWLLLLSSPAGPASMPTAQLLARSGHAVTVVVTDDAVPGAVVHGVTELRAEGVEVLYDEAALRRRGVRERVEPGALRTHDDIAALMLAPQTQVVWR